MKTTTKTMQAVLIKRYHTLCTRLGMSSEDRLALLEPYGVESSLNLTDVTDLQNICNKLDAMLHPAVSQFDTWRKRAMASIGGWLRLIGQEGNASRIKAIACRATGHNNFNNIPLDRLRNVYYLFLNKQKDFKEVERLTSEEIEILSFMN
jgi:hypothetical protein